MQHKKFLFIGGLHRSGTSLITKCIANHSKVSSFHDTGVFEDEGQFLQQVYPRLGQPGGDAPGRFGFDPRTHLTEHSPLLTQENAQKLFEQWQPYWDLEKEVLLEKSPPNIVRTRFLQGCFPNSYFIIVTRHPVANALATKKWCKKNPLFGIILNWVVCHSTFEKDKGKLKNVLVVNYESFVSKPEFWLDKIGKFLGIGHIPLQERIDPSSNSKYFQMWKERKSTYPGFIDAKLSSLLLESSINRFGYSFKDVKLSSQENNALG